MTFDDLKSLALETVTNPAQAAKRVLALDVPMQAVWMGLGLVAVLNGIYYSVLLPGLAQAGLAVPAMVGSPVTLTGFILVIFVLMVFLTAFSGRLLGGIGDVESVGKITVWLQMLRVVAQVVISILSLVSPLLGWLAATALGIWGIWILLNFVAQAHGFNIPKALGTLAVMFVGLIVVMSVLSAALGLAPPAQTGDF
ncbi:YIP1 family protein [Pseudooceanicola onchidii]|uniref:YIP1 family protein n=1 Tax=Pseudooceanicola onchidii TaxID=2562279 RepID=UPI0010AA603B|nr:YIP1 family protein [Pseudooceanicola onchidii]